MLLNINGLIWGLFKKFYSPPSLVLISQTMMRQKQEWEEWELTSKGIFRPWTLKNLSKKLRGLHDPGHLITHYSLALVFAWHKICGAPGSVVSSPPSHYRGVGWGEGFTSMRLYCVSTHRTRVPPTLPSREGGHIPSEGCPWRAGEKPRAQGATGFLILGRYLWDYYLWEWNNGELNPSLVSWALVPLMFPMRAVRYFWVLKIRL